MADHIADHARDLLLADEFPTGALAEVAALTLIGAADLGVAPRGTARALWRFISERPDSEWARKAAGTVGKLPLDSQIVNEAVNVVRMRDTSSVWFELAVEVLGGKSYAREVTPEIVLAAAERATDSYACYLVVELVRTAHAFGCVPTAIVSAVMHGWSNGNDARRERAPDLTMLLPLTDMKWIEKMLTDTNTIVRRNMARVLSHLPKPEDMLDLIDDRLEVESHRAVVAALHAAKADILDRIELPRWPRQ